MRERLKVTLKLDCAGTQHEIPGGNVRELDLHLAPWGVTGQIEFVIQDDSAFGGKFRDELSTDFVKPGLLSVVLRVQAAHTETTTKPEVAVIATQGIACRRRVTQQVLSRGLEAPSVLVRRYRIEFIDAAQFIWEEHFPCGLHVQQTMKSVLDGHKGSNVTLEYDWNEVTTTKPQIFYQLNAKSGYSFYDWVLWYLSEEQGILLFDHDQGSYRIVGAKPKLETPAKLALDEVASTAVEFIAAERYVPRVKNSYVAAPRTAVGTNDHAVAGIYHDVMLATPIDKDVDDALTEQNTAVGASRKTVEVTLARFPTVSLLPGRAVLVPELHNSSPALALEDGGQRVVSLVLKADAIRDDNEESYGETAGGFSLQITATLEDGSDSVVHFPKAVRAPPCGQLEGKVVCEIGEAAETTYEFATDEQRSTSSYRVKVPLFDNQEISVPFEPTSGTPNLYFPLYKDQRVLLGLNFSRAWIERLLEWRPELLTAKERQGQQIFFGKSKQSRTRLLHDYDNDNPVLELLRTHDKDTVVLRLEEGKMLFKVEEQKG